MPRRSYLVSITLCIWEERWGCRAGVRAPPSGWRGAAVFAEGSRSKRPLVKMAASGCVRMGEGKWTGCVSLWGSYSRDGRLTYRQTKIQTYLNTGQAGRLKTDRSIKAWRTVKVHQYSLQQQGWSSEVISWAWIALMMALTTREDCWRVTLNHLSVGTMRPK